MSTTTTHLTPAELDTLLEAAKTATPGPYEARLGSGNNVCTALASVAPDSFDDFVCDVLPDYACKPGIATRWEANRNFIEQANPTTITRLVLMVRELQRQPIDPKPESWQHDAFCLRWSKRQGPQWLYDETLQCTCAEVAAVAHFRARAVRATRQMRTHYDELKKVYPLGSERRAFYKGSYQAANEMAQLIESLPLVETEEE